jgi:hypothetical protein
MHPVELTVVILLFGVMLIRSSDTFGSGEFHFPLARFVERQMARVAAGWSLDRLGEIRVLVNAALPVLELAIAVLCHNLNVGQSTSRVLKKSRICYHTKVTSWREECAVEKTIRFSFFSR